MANWRAKYRQRRQGYRGHPEPPTLVAKLDTRKGRGELWLSGLPTLRTIDQFTAHNFSVQVYCFKNWPEDEHLDGDPGILLPNTLVIRIEMSNPNRRSQDFRAAVQPIVHSLYGGDNVLVHCMSGLARGPMAAALISAVAHHESLQTAMDRIECLRNTQLPDRAWNSMGGIWAIQAVQMDPRLPRYPVGFAAALGDGAVAHAVLLDEEDRYVPLCKGRQGEVMTCKRGLAFEETVARIRLYSSRFCRECRPLLIASQQVQVEYSFGGTGLTIGSGRYAGRGQ